MSRNKFRFVAFPIFLAICLVKSSVEQEVLGCGGFIKSHADIDFSKVEIKLLTKQGSLKDKTDCSPSNGYYFVPIYDKGEYLLRVSPPPGWSFEPEQFELDFDGQTDVCSQGRDVNFVFKGFGITGKVALAGHGNAGARGVDVELKSEDGSDIRTTKTDINGIFSFSPIIPGKYVVKASHPRWHFSKFQHEVIVQGGNTELPENSLVVAGFDLSGRFDASASQGSGIGVAIFRKKGQNLAMKCHRLPAKPLTVENPNYEASSACHTLLDSAGSYKFEAVPPGLYLVQPFVENPNLKLHISPQYIEVEMNKDSVEVKDTFKITGFSVSGRVLTAPGGLPLGRAVVKMNGQRVATTDSEGYYSLQNLVPGAYKLQVESPKLKFEEKQFQLELSTERLPDIFPKSYEVCGHVVSKKSHVVGITKHASTFHTTTSSNAESGEWCTYLPNGKFAIEVVTSEADRASGIQFYPVQQNIEVGSQPLSGITFSQLRATLRGEISCLPDAPAACTEADVTLHSLDASGLPTGDKRSAKARNGKYSFKDILPGPYEITIPSANLCYESNRVLINVATATETAPQFKQLGYEVSIVSSHKAIMKYTYVPPTKDNTPTGAASRTETLKLLDGVNTFCVPRAGSYNIKLESCHLYDESLPKSFSTIEAGKPILINAAAHKVGVRVLSTEANAHDLELAVDVNRSGERLVTPVAESHKVDGKYAYRYETYLKPDEILTVRPLSEVLLFTPQFKEIVGARDCVDIAFNFFATRGLILRGKIVPPIKDATITLTFPKNSDLKEQTTLSNANGEFKFAPIDETLDYDLKAEKESYVFSAYHRQTSTFSAHKLCEIIVKVQDESGKGLGGVLLSLSGAESYRKNLVTSDNGAINFHSLSPSQYFLRPMMKEYKFEPNSKIIQIKDGETVEVELVGKRVAYSAFGTITSLNGEPFGQVNIEAISDDQCMHHQEEATSESNGQYRLRGLQPGCTYSIRPKESSRTNVERSIPSSHSVKVAQEDVRGINLIGISPLSFVDVTARITASLNEHYKTLRLVMYRKGASDSTVYSQRVETPLNLKSHYNPGIMVFFPRIPLDGKTYVVELQSTLNAQTYSYRLPSQKFVADTGSVFVELDFKPEIRTAEADLNQNSISALVLVALVAIAFFKQDIAMDCLNFVWSKVNAIVQDIAQKQQKNSQKNQRKPEPINQKEIEQMAEQINAIKKKKTKKI